MSEDQPILNPTQVRELMGDDEALIREFVDVALTEVEELAARCVEAAKGGDLAQAGLSAHAVKGAAANLGGERLRALAHRAEQACKAGQAECVSLASGLPGEAAALRQAAHEQGWCGP